MLHHLNSHPQITINDFSYRGDIDFKDLKQAICSAYKVRPGNCNISAAFDGSSDKVSIFANATAFGKFMLVFKATHFFLLGLLIILCNIALIFIIRRRNEKKQSKMIRVKVNEAIGQYFSLQSGEN